MDGTPFGRYRLQELLGRGGMGEVWRAFDTVTERVVALKVLPTQYADDATFQERFRREAKSAAGLDEPHVVPIYDFGEIDGRLFVTMRLIQGRDLHAILGDGPMDPARAVGIIDQIASALHAAHEINLIHRDVKPSNILVGEDDFAYLIDFGIARVVGETGLTSGSGVIGTWAYMAPERITAGQTDARADVYALACVLYECLTGAPPFGHDSLEQQIGGHLSLAPPRAAKHVPGVPAALDAVIAKGMAKNPDERHASTRELARAARTALRESPTGPNTVPGPAVAHRPLVSPPSPKASRKRWVIAFSSIGAAAIVVAVVAALALSNASDRDSRTAAASSATGPLTGTFTVAMGQKTNWIGSPLLDDADAAAFSETWRLRSACGANGCVATAVSGGRYPANELVFDKVGDRWLAVTTSSRKCKDHDDTEAWSVVSLQPQADGTESGEWTDVTTDGCLFKRTVTFTRGADTDLSQLPDPSKLPARAVSPAEALRGSYDSQVIFADGQSSPAEHLVVRTDCLRSGDRCVSPFHPPMSTGDQTFVFAKGTWTRAEEFEAACSLGGTFVATFTATLALPQPPQNPIQLLSGHGQVKASPGTKCRRQAFDQTLTRTGD